MKKATIAPRVVEIPAKKESNNAKKIGYIVFTPVFRPSYKFQNHTPVFLGEMLIASSSENIIHYVVDKNEVI